MSGKMTTAVDNENIVWRETAGNKTAETPVLLDAGNNDSGAVVDGFGDGITLVMAVRDIAPMEYQFSFGREVDLSAPVDWQGGKPWKEVLTGVLKTQGLHGAIYGQMIVVSGNDQAPPPPLPGVSVSSDAKTMMSVTPVAQAVTPQKTEPQKTEPAMAPVSLAPPPVSAAVVERSNYDAKTHEAMIAQMTQSPVKPAPAYVPVMEKPVDVIRWEPAVSEVTQAKEEAKPVEKPQLLYSSVATVYAEKEVEAPVVAPLAPAQVEEKIISSIPPAAVAQDVPVAAAIDNAWRAPQGAFLHDVLKEWSERAGVSLLWTIDYDYRLPQTKSFSGDFAQAVGGLLNGFEKSRPQPFGRLHQRKDGGASTLVIKSY